MSRVRLIGKSKRNRGLGVITDLSNKVNVLQRVPQGSVVKVETPTTILVEIDGELYRVSATKVK